MAAGVFAKLPLTTIPFRPVAPEPNFMSVGVVLKYHKGRNARKTSLLPSRLFRVLQRKAEVVLFVSRMQEIPAETF